MKAIYIKPIEHFDAMIAGEPQALMRIGVWSKEGKSVTLSFDTSLGEEPHDNSNFTVCIPDALELITAIRRAVK